MTSFAALTLLAAAQGPFKPPTGPIGFPPPPTLKVVNLIGNPGFENSALSPWFTYGDAYYYNGDGTVQYAPASFTGKLVPHGSGRCFDLNLGYARKPGDPRAYQAAVYLRQTLPNPVRGSAILDASTAIYNFSAPLSVTIEYTTGAPTYVGAPNSKDQWIRWSFLGAIDPNRDVKGIEFSVADISWAIGGSAQLDDVSLSVIAPK